MFLGFFKNFIFPTSGRYLQTCALNRNNGFSSLAMEPFQVEPYISSGEDNVQCTLCQQERPLQLQTSNCNAALKLSGRYKAK